MDIHRLSASIKTNKKLRFCKNRSFKGLLGGFNYFSCSA